MYTRIIQHSISTNFRLILHRQHEWWSDYPWFIRRLEGHRILDLGYAAHTFFTRIVCEYGFDVTGVDFQQAAACDWSVGGANFTYVSADVRALPLEDDSFDTVVAPSLLEHVGLGFYSDGKATGGPEKALAEWRRVMKPGGVLLVQVPYGAVPRVIDLRGRPYYRI